MIVLLMVFGDVVILEQDYDFDLGSESQREIFFVLASYQNHVETFHFVEDFYFLTSSANETLTGNPPVDFLTVSFLFLHRFPAQSYFRFSQVDAQQADA